MKHIGKILTCLFFLLNAHCLMAQYPEGESLFQRGEYAKAEAYYARQLKQNPSSMTLRYRVGKCQLLQHHYEASIETLEPLKKRSNAPKELYMLLGEAYFGAYRFVESVESYSTYQQKGGDVNVTAKLRLARSAVSMLESVDDIIILDSVVVDKKQLLSCYHLSKDIGILTDESNDSLQLTGFLAGRKDRKIVALDCDSTISLFESNCLLDGKWSTPTPLQGEVNNLYHQNYPFLHPDGVTLYFASCGENSLGGYDIFRANSNGNGYLEPRNIGFPYNSTANDYLLVVDEFSGIGWFATDRRQPEDKVIIYTFVPNKIRKNFEGTTDEKLLRAQMKQYVVSDSVRETVVNEERQEKRTADAFVINDNITYYSVDDFKSEEAKNHYSQFLIINQLYQDVKEQLVVLRKDYAAGSSEQRSDYTAQIIALEQQLMSLRTAMKKAQQQARNTEIEWLNTNNKIL
ncbi:MAG: hypothetical protein Q4D14_03510 [Bacteroidales bacterium]|nr:hypothetical protein [Bacteroidales bacterium]